MKKIGVLLANLGTPDEPTTPAVKRYLRQFLSDPRVIDLPKWRWKFILNCLVLPKRVPKVAQAYKTIWTEDGSPLLSISRQQQAAIQTYFCSQNNNIVIELGMSYGNPSIQSAVDSLIAQDVEKIIILPLYPQYSSTTTASVLDAFAQALYKHKKVLPFEFIHNYHNHPLYIKALANTVTLTENELLLFSFHGIPARYEAEGDFYSEQCRETARLVAKELNLTENQWLLSFQSRFGSEEWLQPYTDELLSNLPTKNIKNIAVICPGFAADCLETIEEIAEENQENFKNAGGNNYRYISALNANSDHISFLVKLIESKLD
ncbi:ferrochelatase [Glaesserella parasuis]|uniref:ferrochelatase n=1 Tax=Glaesserella parasuis TaxID=738 RepID=UPI00094FA5DF|nr:ferrochelatase [Glaesserella parasuis]MDG4923055.1 ferrochelatase [Glaesserella parasuis]MDG6227650.1 ferrochelatase [Glaesserella parasuis]MDG6233543.1 ferrochelatase [Glaesserella parasuis]MDG6253129.1 ferrochelatase [Glaesserella parasuis]MDG6261717.1 ferrochelatase [Glaesserella parasuis]